MRRRFALLGGSSAIVVFVACGLELRGEGTSIGLPDGSSDGAPSDVAAADQEPPPPTPGCVVEIDDALGGIDETRWMRILDQEADSQGLPKGETVGTQSHIVLAREGLQWARAGIFLRNAVPTNAFDIAFDFALVCLGGCADGFAAAWLETTSEQALGNANDAHALGIPTGVRGGAVAIDLFKNSETNDDQTPNLQILDIDPTKQPGDYDWSVQSSQTFPTIYATGHHVELRLRSSALKLVMDGITLREGIVVPSGFEGTFGFVGATGNQTATMVVHHLKAKFYRCDAPP